MVSNIRLRWNNRLLCVCDLRLKWTEGSADKFTLFRTLCIPSGIPFLGSLRACLSRHNDVLNKGQQGRSPSGIFSSTGKEEEACGPLHIHESLQKPGFPTAVDYCLELQNLWGCYGPWERNAGRPLLAQPGAGCCSVLSRPFQKLYKGIPTWGGTRTGH